jgi:tetrahydromethanopterin S-methyltransferase subunit B
MTYWWLAMWSSNNYSLTEGEYIAIYSGFMIGATLMNLLRFKLMASVTTRSSKNIFN